MTTPIPTVNATESARASFINRLCQEIEASRAEGKTVWQAIRRARRHSRARLFRNGRPALGSLVRYYYTWRRERTAEVFLRHYKAGKPRVPVALMLEFLNRLAGERVVSAATAMRSLRSDWQMGATVPGLGTWHDYMRRTRGESVLRATSPAFPFSYRTLCRYLAPKNPEAYGRRGAAALRAQRELNSFLAFIDARRRDLEARTAHEPLGQSFRPKQ